MGGANPHLIPDERGKIYIANPLLNYVYNDITTYYLVSLLMSLDHYWRFQNRGNKASNVIRVQSKKKINHDMSKVRYPSPLYPPPLLCTKANIIGPHKKINRHQRSVLRGIKEEWDCYDKAEAPAYLHMYVTISLPLLLSEYGRSRSSRPKLWK